MLDEEKSASKGKVIKRFVYEAKWFVMNQTDGADYKLPEMPSWNKDTALAGLGITEIPFAAPVSGNCQGFARKDQVAINPLAQLPHKTLFHEMAHVVLGHTKADNYQAHGAELPLSLMEVEAESTAMLLLDALELPGAEYCRGYIQNWLGEGKEIPESSAKRIIAAAEKILRAGQQKAQQKAAA